MTEQEYIIFLRYVVTQSKIDKLTADQITRMQARYSGVIERLFNEIQNPAEVIKSGGDLVRISDRINGLIRQSDLLEQLGGDIADLTTAVGELSYDDYNKALSWDGRVIGFNEVIRTAEELREQAQIAQIGDKVLSQWVDTLFDGANMDAAVNAALPDFLDVIEASRLSGAGYQKMVENLARQFEDFTEDDLTTLARSYTQSMNVKAHTDVYTANRDLVKKIEWSAKLENGNFSKGTGTCPRCAALDGNQYDMADDGQPLDGPECPLHARCRCLLLPITPTWRELGFDIDEMEQAYRPWVIRTENAIWTGGNRELIKIARIQGDYATWFDSQSAAFQNAVVGVNRAELIRGDYFGFKDIVDNRGELIPIRDLRIKYNVPPDIKWITGGGGSAPPNLSIAVPPWVAALNLTNKRLESWAAYASINITPNQQAAFEKAIAQFGEFDITNEKRGAWHNATGPSSGQINMPDAYFEVPRGAATFWHEFGHYLDNVYSEQIDETVQGAAFAYDNYRDYLSNSGLMSAARLSDEKAMKKWRRDEFHKFGGTGRYSHENYYKVKGEAVGAFIEELLIESKGIKDLPTDFTESMIAIYSDYLEKNSKGNIRGLYDLTVDLKRYLSVDQYNRALNALSVATRYKTKNIIADQWLPNVDQYFADRDGKLIGYLADLVGATTKEYYGGGHGINYYNEAKYRQGAQAFANLFLTHEHKEISPFLKLFTPNQKRAFDNIIKEIIK